MQRISSLRRGARAAGGVIVAAILAASCGSDSSSSDESAASATVETSSAISAPTADSAATNDSASPTTEGDTTSTEAGSASTADSTDEASASTEDVLGAPSAASGDPVLVGIINSVSSDTLGDVSAQLNAGYEIAMGYANDYLGGVAGRPIKLESCDDKGTPAGATDCANQLVEKGIDVYVEPYQAYEAEIVKVLAPAGIPLVVSAASTNEGLTTPGVFAISGGVVAQIGAFAIAAKEKSLTSFAMVTIDVPSATAPADALGKLTFGKEGVPYQVVPVPPGTPDMTPQLQAAIASGVDSFGVIGDATFCTSFLQAYQTLALTVPKFIIPTCVDPNVIAAVPDALAGSYVGLSRAAGPDDAIYAATVEKYGDGSIDPNPNVSSAVADGWGALMGFVNAMQGYSGAVDPASIIAQMKAAKDVTVPLGGGLHATCDGTAIPILANICSGDVQIAVVDSQGGFSDFEKIEAAEAFAP